MSKKLETLGLVEVTSQRQADNGTVCFHDPQTGCDYLSYESGYVRRKYTTKSWWSGESVTSIYQLNKTRMVGRTFKTKERILEPNSEKRIDMLAKAVVNYRNTVKNY